MSNPYAEHTQAKAVERVADALERIADASEAANRADPLTMLAQMAEEGAGIDPQEPFASNGSIRIYALVDGWHIVARQDASAESGYAVAIERV